MTAPASAIPQTVAEVDLSHPDFWMAPTEVREAAFALLRKESPIAFHKEFEVPPHYDATITVYKVVDGKKERVTEPFSGTWTAKGCFEDSPDTLVNMAIKLAKKEKP